MRSDFSPCLAGVIDASAARREFAARSRVRIANFMTEDSAEQLHRCLRESVPWKFAYSQHGRNVLVDDATRSGPPPPEVLQAVHEQARSGFQYLYRSYPMVTAYLAGADPGLPLHAMLEWLNTPQMLELIRGVTGIGSIRKGDAQATWYAPGNFLTLHDDTGAPREERRVAYVLNLSKRWQPDWGGLLQFVDATGAVAETWLPTYNSLALFKVPVRHMVSCVAPFVTEPRFAITGWFRDA